MHLYKLVIILLIQYVGLNLAVKVCFPYTFEGHRHEAGTKKPKFFAIDFTAQRLYETKDDSDSDNFNIFDFAGGYKFKFEGGNCRAEAFENEMVFDQCVDNDFKLSALSLGELNNGIDVKVIGFRRHRLDRKLLVTKANGEYYLPFFMQDRGDDDKMSTSFFFKLTDYISERGNPIYTDVTNCVHEE